MTRFASIALALLLLCTAAQAQRRGPQRSAEQRAQRLTELQAQKIGLTAEQTTQIQAINLQAFQRMDAARTAHSGDRQEAMQLLRDIQQERDAQTLAVLTDEQKLRYEAAKEEFRAAMRERMQQRRGGRSGRQ